MTEQALPKFEADLALELVCVVEEAAIASARTMGEGDRDKPDRTLPARRHGGTAGEGYAGVDDVHQ